MNDVTQILSQIEQGDPTAAEQLLPLVYQELRKLAAENEVRAELVKLRDFAGAHVERGRCRTRRFPSNCRPALDLRESLVALRNGRCWPGLKKFARLEGR